MVLVLVLVLVVVRKAMFSGKEDVGEREPMEVDEMEVFVVVRLV
jgi:hypothetical protein